MLIFFTKLIFCKLNINLIWQHFVFSSCVSCGMKSHQLGKVFHWQIALVRPKHPPKGKRSMCHFPRHSVASEKGGHIYVLRTLQYSAALGLLLACNTLLQRETSPCPGLLPGIYLKSEGAETGFVLEALPLLRWCITVRHIFCEKIFPGDQFQCVVVSVNTLNNRCSE